MDFINKIVSDSIKLSSENTKENNEISIVSDNYMLSDTILLDKLKKSNEIPCKDLFIIIKNSIDKIINNILKNNDSEFIDFFTDKDFLSTINKVLLDIDIEDSYILCINKIIYDYLTIADKDNDIKNLLLSIGKNINKKDLPHIVAIGIPEDIALSILIARYSTSNQIIAVKRVNFILTTSPIEIMTENNIMEIYNRIFNQMTPLLIGTMLDVYNDEEEWITDDIMEIYSCISIIVLTLLNDMPINDIRDVISEYNNTHIISYPDKPHRFSMRSISMDFNRIVQCVQSLTSEGVLIL